MQPQEMDESVQAVSKAESGPMAALEDESDWEVKLKMMFNFILKDLNTAD